MNSLYLKIQIIGQLSLRRLLLRRRFIQQPVHPDFTDGFSEQFEVNRFDNATVDPQSAAFHNVTLQLIHIAHSEANAEINHATFDNFATDFSPFDLKSCQGLFHLL